MILFAPFALLPLVGLLVLALVVGWLGGGISGLSDTWSSTIGKFLGAGVAIVAIVVGGAVLLAAMGIFRQGTALYRITDAIASTFERLADWGMGIASSVIDPLLGLLGVR